MNRWSHRSWTLHGAPRIASSSTMRYFLLQFSRYSITLDLIFTAYTFSPIFLNFLSSLPQMEPMPSQVRNHYSQKNHEAHLQRALEFKKAANLRCPSNGCLPIILHRALCIVVRMNNVPDFNIEAGWRYQSGDQWWQKWRPRRVHLIVRHQRRWVGSPPGSTASRPGEPGQVITNYMGCTAKVTQPRRSC